ncbi:hypothetical protein BT96DRAFT_692035 [Gymnopus androsaceus JB14]|uniref:Uncharacterized protein n=1 Tax=Gymnopus androsaceus JB14 TaxID=1447944 RepID=A0A6A4HR25_9AGAR|nr:hypothetical protein BT96DRAFT_692035 [Gymnopus androsaceus JB14]
MSLDGLERKPDSLIEEDARNNIFLKALESVKIAYKSPDQLHLQLVMPSPTSNWPNNMGMLTNPKNSMPGVQKRLHLIRPRSGASLFWGYEIVFLAEMSSHSRKNDLWRMLAQAAF